MTLPFIAIAVAVLTAIAAWRTRRTEFVVPLAICTVTAWSVAGCLFVAADELILAVIAIAAGLGTALIAAFVISFQPPKIVRRAPAPCPSWCDLQHSTFGPGQLYIPHQRIVGGHDLADGGIIEVRVSWLERLVGPAGDSPALDITLLVGDGSIHMDLTETEAGMLGTVLAADAAARGIGAYASALASDAGWLARALAEGAQILGYQDETTR